MKQNDLKIPKQELEHKTKHVELVDKETYLKQVFFTNHRTAIVAEKLRFNFLFNLNKTIINYKLNTAYYLN